MPSGAYSGVGSRETPEGVLKLMIRAAYHLAQEGRTLRSGGAPGADKAFSAGHIKAVEYERLELYLPWPKFEQWEAEQLGANGRDHPQREAFQIAAEYHPAWETLKPGAKSLHARNVHQVLGPDVTAPHLSDFLLCWTPAGKGGGGTGQAIRIATAHGVPVFDLALPDVRARIEKMVKVAA